MDAKELRLGNIVRHKYMKDLSYLKVRIIDGYGLHGRVFVIPVHGNSRHDFIIEEIEPILITEEILKKCGFVEMSKNGNYLRMTYIKDARLHHWRKMEKDGVPFISYRGIEYDNIQYLHQLQNLYFSITNKELEVKL